MPDETTKTLDASAGRAGQKANFSPSRILTRENSCLILVRISGLLNSTALGLLVLVLVQLMLSVSLTVQRQPRPLSTVTYEHIDVFWNGLGLAHQRVKVIALNT